MKAESGISVDGDPVTAGPLETKAWVVGRMSEHNDERVVSRISQVETQSDEGTADPSLLTSGHHSDGSKPQNRHLRATMEADVAEEGLAHDDPVVFGHKGELGDAVGRVPDQLDEARLVGATEGGCYDTPNHLVVRRRLGTEDQAQSLPFSSAGRLEEGRNSDGDRRFAAGTARQSRVSEPRYG